MRRAVLLTLLSRCPGADTVAFDEVLDLSVNDAAVEVAPAGPSALLLQTQAGENPVSAFGGDGLGNKAIAGLPGFDGLPLASFGGLGFRAGAGAGQPYANVIVDLGCDSADLVLVVASGAPAGPDGSVAYAADASQWRAVGGLPGLLPGHLEAATGSLSDVSAAFPDACLRDADTGDAGLPAGRGTPAVMLILGDSRNAAALSVELSAVQVSGARVDLSEVVDVSVNRASATPGRVLPGGLVLHTGHADNAVGGFGGAGTGNKAIAGLPGLDGTPLASVRGLGWESMAVEGAGVPYANLIVDLGCDGQRLALVVASGAGTAVAPGRTGYAFDARQPVWRAVGGLDALLPGHLDPAAGRLADVVAAYPDACLADAMTGDAGLPAGEVTPAAMVILGDSLNHTPLEQRIFGIQVGAVTYRYF